MTDIGYRLSDPARQYVGGETSKEEFKKSVRKVEMKTDGANWWTVSMALLDEVHKSDHQIIAEPLTEMYGSENTARIFGADTIGQIMQ